MPSPQVHGTLAALALELAGLADSDSVLHATAGHLVRGQVDFCFADLLTDPDLVTRVVTLGRDGPLDLLREQAVAGRMP